MNEVTDFGFDRRISIPYDRDHIETRWCVEQVVLFEIDECRASDPVLFRERHGRRGIPFTVALPSLHFDEYDAAAINGDDVDFAAFQPMPLRDDFIAELFEKVCSDSLAGPTESFIRIGWFAPNTLSPIQHATGSKPVAQRSDPAKH